MSALDVLPGLSRKISLRIPGKPQPGGSKRGVGGGNFTRIIDANPKVGDWKRTVQFFAQESGVQMLDGPLRATVTFVMARPGGHFGARGLKASAPKYHTVVPDATKLWRSTEDALKGFAYRDDSKIAVQHVEKIYSNDGWTGVVIEVEEMNL